MEIGVVSRKRETYIFAKANYSQLQTRRLREDKIERKIFNVREQKSGHPSMSALTVQLSSYSCALKTFATALAKMQGVNYILNKVLIYKL